MRIASTLACVLVVSFSGLTKADDHHHAFWKFLVGTWEYELSVGEDYTVKGETTTSMAETGDALISTLKGEDGSSYVEVAGWKPDKKVVSVVAYGADGTYWESDLDEISADGHKGSTRLALADGMIIEGTTESKKVDEDTVISEIVGKSSDGEEIVIKIKSTRKKKSSGPQPLQVSPN